MMGVPNYASREAAVQTIRELDGVRKDVVSLVFFGEVANEAAFVGFSSTRLGGGIRPSPTRRPPTLRKSHFATSPNANTFLGSRAPKCIRLASRTAGHIRPICFRAPRKRISLSTGKTTRTGQYPRRREGE